MIPEVLRKHAPEFVSRAYGKWHQGFLNSRSAACIPWLGKCWPFSDGSLLICLLCSYTPVGRGFDSFFGCKNARKPAGPRHSMILVGSAV